MSSQAPSTPPAGTVFDRVRASGLVRPERSAGPGVCRALADRLGVDPLIVRIVVVVLSVCSGVGLLAYGFGWLLLPEADGRIHAEDLALGAWSWGVAGASALAVAGLVTFVVQLTSDGGVSLSALAVGAMILGLLWLRRRSLLRAGWPAEVAGRSPGRDAAGPPSSRHPVGTPTGLAPAGPVDAGAFGPGGPQAGPLGALPAAGSSTPVPSTAAGSTSGTGADALADAPEELSRAQRPPAAGPRIVAATLGLILVLLAVIGGLNVAAVPLPGGHLSWAFVGAIVVLGVATVIVGLAGRRCGGLAPLAGLTLASGLIAIGGVQPDHPLWTSYLEDESRQPATWSVTGSLSGDREYDAGLRSRTLDLSRVTPPADGTVHTINVDASLGSLHVILPSDLTVELDIDHDWGSLEVDGEVQQSSPTTIRLGPDEEPDLRLTGSADLGVLAVDTE